MYSIKHNFIITFLITFFILLISSYGQTGSIAGRVIDATDNSPLYGTNILLLGTSMGTTTDIDGRYRLTGIPQGNVTVIYRYIGYRSDTVKVRVVEGKTIIIDVKLKPEVIEGQEIVVTAQLSGQAAAINQQITSNTIVNVVSKDKIEELPDQNAAESLGRLPGISIQRNAGEGSKVVVRGLSPKFNSITINGERIPSTDPTDRSVDLSMISSEMLAGIEVYKALTPDKDADAVGGTVNFVLKKAPNKKEIKLKFQGGYNNHANDYDVYKGSVSYSNRIFNDNLGFLITTSIEKQNRSSHILDAAYTFAGKEVSDLNTAKVGLTDLNLGDRIETRKRFGFSLSLDYDFGNAITIQYNSFFSQTIRDELRRRKRYRVDSAILEYDLRDSDFKTNVFTNSLSGELYFGNLQMTWRGSYTSTLNNIPYQHISTFRELAGFTSDLVYDQGPEIIPQFAKNTINETFFKFDRMNNSKTRDADLTFQIDFKWPFLINESIGGYVKFGAKIRDKRRTFDDNSIWTSYFNLNQLGLDMFKNPNFYSSNYRLYTLTSQAALSMVDFLDNNFSVKNFLNGRYQFTTGLSVSALEQFYSTYANYALPNGQKIYEEDPLANLRDYKAGEMVSSGYLMTELNFERLIQIVGGIRIEKTDIDYKSIFGTPEIGDDEQSIGGVKDTVGIRSYTEILPMIQMKIKPLDWMDIRVAVTKTLSRPDYFSLVPKEIIDRDAMTIRIGDPNIKHTKVWNYDLFISFYNQYGMFTLGGFYKELRDIDYIRNFPRLESRSDPYYGWLVEGPINGKWLSTVKGLEIEIQTNFTWLPAPFDGIILTANFSKINSKTYFPFFKVETKYISTPPFVVSYAIDTVRSGRIPGQADYVANFVLGYEKGGFSGRISAILQGKSLDFVAGREEFDGFTEEFIKWDLAVKQKLIKGLSVYLSVNNLNNRPELATLGFRNYSTREEFFGWTADLGLQYEF